MSERSMRVPAPVAELGRRALAASMRGLFGHLLDTHVVGGEHVPPSGGYIVAANHGSHLDSGLVKHALGAYGDRMVSLAAKDYFFDPPRRRLFFENFTNLIPMERHGSLRESLRLATEVVRAGYILLIFPEGTRAKDGVMIDFKPSLGYLAMSSECGILPMFLAGPYDAMPRGTLIPRRVPITAHVGPLVTFEQVRALAGTRARGHGYRAIAAHVEGLVRGLAPASHAWALGPSGRAPAAPSSEQA
ncbi:MAG: lysophospholipid acyltransferase family protein [Kofleriaceae bacterium]